MKKPTADETPTLHLIYSQMPADICEDLLNGKLSAQAAALFYLRHFRERRTKKAAEDIANRIQQELAILKQETFTVAADGWNPSEAKVFADKQQAFRFARKTAKALQAYVNVMDDAHFMLGGIDTWRFAPDGKMFRSRSRGGEQHK